MRHRLGDIRLAYRFIILKSLPWLLAAGALIALIAFTEVETLFQPRELDLLHAARAEELLLLGGIAAVLLLRLAYTTLYRFRHLVSLKHNVLTVSHGLLFRRHRTVPLAKVTQVELGRDLLHLLVGLCFLEISTPGVNSENSQQSPHRIEGLRKLDAVVLKAGIEQAFSKAEHLNPRVVFSGSEIDPTNGNQASSLPHDYSRRLSLQVVT